ncbi:MAG: hypothetical protein RLZZ524_261, partial [Pseudomonadota bacterium]
YPEKRHEVAVAPEVLAQFADALARG